ncbi:N-acetyl-gamma-glutamyl-phosphate reductase [Georgenia sp. Z1344]|uniref:N-acetyl-gamma-glutamyl-phosphate reductase n=1 Tax=Georgenia sp. Z1344 TaxID=3416706 RepID=UPI003CE69008
MSFSIAVAGASGYAGGEVLRLALTHPDLTVGALTANSSAGDPLLRHQPHLLPLADLVLEPTDPTRLAEHDVVVLALPHGASGEVTAALDELGYAGLVVDAGADHRLTDPTAWDDFYGTPHAGAWPYGLPELLHADETAPAAQRTALTTSRRIAVPGCNVTAVTLALQPGVAADVVDSSDVVAVLAVGYSGAGKSLKPHLTAAEAAGNLQPYGLAGTHRHVPEIEQNLTVAGAATPKISFTPVLAPISRGILATVTAPLAEGATAEDVAAAWHAAYDDEPFVRLLPEGTWPTASQVAGSNLATVQVAVDHRAGRVVALCAIDNLVKGTAGGAIQSLNLALGLDETAGLPTTGVAP